MKEFTKKVVYVDIDDCLVHTTPRLKELLIQHYGEIPNAEKHEDTWNLGYTEEQVEATFKLDCFYDTINPSVGCDYTLRKLKKRGYELVAFSKSSYATSSKMRMLERFGIFDDFIICSLGFNKGLVDMDRPNELTIFIEDTPTNLMNSNCKYKVLNQCYGHKSWQDNHTCKNVLTKWIDLLNMCYIFENYEQFISEYNCK